jgi:predicted GNAT family N-acyltransferase
MLDDALTYRLMNPKDVVDVSELVLRVFNELLAPEYPPEGIQEFQRYVQPSALLARSQANHFTIISLVQNCVVGMIEVREYSHISLLFVAQEYHGQGIAKTLWHKALQVCQRHEPGLSQISVNSSCYAVPIYEKLGFSPIGGKQVKNGITFVPMILIFSNS